MHIAVVDDDPEALENIYHALHRDVALSLTTQCNHLSEWKVVKFGSSKKFKRDLKKHQFDLILLDWELPDESGIQVMQWIRTYLSPAPPVILITHRSTEEDVVEALTSGADDFISKPFRPKELLARVLSALRRSNSLNSTNAESDQLLLKLNSITIDKKNEIIYLRDQPVNLTNNEYRLALALFSQINRPIARFYLYDTIWGQEEHYLSRTLDVHIYRLRKKLELTTEHGWQLSSIYGYGYRLQLLENSQDLKHSAI